VRTETRWKKGDRVSVLGFAGTIVKVNVVTAWVKFDGIKNAQMIYADLLRAAV
jgi:hypothetical protein